MQVITAYKIITLTSERQFSEDVNNLIQLGWQPLGPPVLGSGNRLTQAMVSWDEPKQNKQTSSFGPG